MAVRSEAATAQAHVRAIPAHWSVRKVFLRVAAYQAPLTMTHPGDAVAQIRGQVDRCESAGVDVLCCPEAVLGGLGDFVADSAAHALDVETGELAAVLAPLSSPRVTTIVGFTERGAHGRLFNAAAVLHRGAVVGVYRKHRPAIRHSIYQAGTALPVFRVDRLAFGVLICNDSNFPELAQSLVARGAQALFIPSNNGLPPQKADVAADTRRGDAVIARTHRIAVIRADVAGRTDALVAYGTSGITGPDGTLRQEAAAFASALLIGDIAVDETGGRRDGR